MKKIELEILKFVRLPKDKETGEEIKDFEKMIGHLYGAYVSEFNNEYVIVGAKTKEGLKAFQDGIYNSLLTIGESEETAKGVAYGDEEIEMCLYFPPYCFE